MRIDPSTIDAQPDLVSSSEVLASGQWVYFRPLCADNPRAVHFYTKFGFQRVGEFEAGGTNNYDMIAELR